MASPARAQPSFPLCSALRYARSLGPGSEVHVLLAAYREAATVLARPRRVSPDRGGPMRALVRGGLALFFGSVLAARGLAAGEAPSGSVAPARCLPLPGVRDRRRRGAPAPEPPPGPAGRTAEEPRGGRRRPFPVGSALGQGEGGGPARGHRRTSGPSRRGRGPAFPEDRGGPRPPGGGERRAERRTPSSPRRRRSWSGCRG